MTYGASFKNNSDIVTIDSEFSRLVVLEKGTWSGTGAGVFVPFAKTVTTSEPPLVFVRPSQSNLLCFCLIQGSSGAWTGFSFSGIVGTATSGAWFSAAFMSQPTASYGLRLWDGSAKLLFDNGTPCAQFTRSISSWTYLGATQTSQGVYRYSWTAPSSLSSGDYMMLNNIAMDMAGVVSRQGNMYAVWEYQNNRLVMQAVGVDLPSAFYMPVVFAKPVA
ncbi:hypothetical protein HBO01_21620 [Pseudomonas rhodesiae]|uniref:hypothetical protein n=1 Tax=Pseudomonas rhodesiae TaxID=76760 RepID=UPI0014735CFD|nr:hypothetical protein [Pseudomonas rhodesiae]NMY81287.1 hypothetical protein [Pseudomonas rhodesiae]